jgi:hypothetical protein
MAVKIDANVVEDSVWESVNAFLRTVPSLPLSKILTN